MRKICLHDLDQSALIILENSGVIYYNQCGGTACSYREAEGILVPISNDPPLDHLHKGSLGYLLSQHCPCGKPSREAIPAMNTILAQCICTDQITVNEDKLHDSEEAWIHVSLKATPPHSLLSTEFGTEALQAILTWSNSD